LSYAVPDREFAGRLARTLDSQGVSGFLDSLDVTAGAPWGDQLREALRNADILVVVLTAAAVRSTAVISEIGAAWAADKRIFGIVPPNEPVPGDLPFHLNRAQRLLADGLSDEVIAATLREQLAA
jgi:hypothetical protein